MVSRLTLLTAVFVLGYSVLIFNLYNLQLYNGQYYLVRAESQYAASDILTAARGTIYFTDKNGNHLPAVSNKDFSFVYAVPKMIEDPTETANRLADALGRPVGDLLKQLSKPNDTYELIQKKLPKDAVAKLTEARLKGVYVAIEPERFYPFGALAAHVLGFVAPNPHDPGQSGRYGMEEYYDDRLAGTPGQVQGNKVVAPDAGKNVVLTIDPNIQIEAEHILNDLVSKYSASGGAFIVAEPKTGKVLAMGANPSFDPNSYSGYEIGMFLNPITQALYEPGSVFKVITMAAGIDAGKITPETKYFDNGQITVSGKTIKNWDLKAHGWMTMTEVIENSLNTGSSFAEAKTGDANFRDYVTKFGFGEKTGINLPGELRGNIRALGPHAPSIAFAAASFGQGISVTPIEMISALAALANGGKLMRPYLNADDSPQVIRQVVGEEAAQKVTGMMVSAVDKANVASIKGYSLAGKTGTAQVPDLKNGGYTDKVIDTYIGFGPTSDPRFIILIRLNQPSGGVHAAETVVPAFRELAQFILNYYNIPPDRL